jgi:uncharacterized protein
VDRYLQTHVESDVRRKMVFVSGPRQVGKTTLARRLLSGGGIYLNWDVPDDRERILRSEFPANGRLVLDEIHKNPSWRDVLKGLYDGRGDSLEILVTGSARLDAYRYGGDSLQGRYYHYRLYPLSVAEIGASSSADLESLLDLGGFPEPFLSGSEVEARRWSLAYRTLLVYEEVRSVEQIGDLAKLELLMLRLPELVGSPLSVNSLREDLQVAHKTASSWIDVLERLFAIVRIPPLGGPLIRAVKKEIKHYHIDWTLVRDRGLRFENMVAIHLLKWVHFLRDTAGRDMELRYFRDVDKREVDFVVTENQLPVTLIETKYGDSPISPGLRYLHERYPDAEALQLSAAGSKDYLSKEGIRVIPATAWLGTLI